MVSMTTGERSSVADKLAEEDLVRRHLPLVQYAVAEVASRVPRHVSRGDLVSAGMVGLAQAARSYDPSRGIAFDRYANQRIRGALLDELRSRDWASRTVRAKARAVTAATDHLTFFLTPWEFRPFVEEHPEVAWKLLQNLARRLRAAQAPQA